MLVMTFSEARQNFATALDSSKRDGAVIIKRADGSVFKITPEIPKSPFEGIKTLADIKKEEIFLALRETREENWLFFLKRLFIFEGPSISTPVYIQGSPLSKSILNFFDWASPKFIFVG